MSILNDAVPNDDPTLAFTPPPIYTFPSHNTAVWRVLPTGVGALSMLFNKLRFNASVVPHLNKRL